MRIILKQVKRVMCIILTLLLLSSAFCVEVFAQDVPARKTLMHGSYTLYALYSETTEEEYFYSDSFFDKSGKETDEHLRTLSAAVCFSLNQITKNNGSGSVLKQIGFSDVVMYDMNGSTSDSIGTVIAKKKIGDSTVVALMLRGYNYGGEWVSNFHCGSEGDANGFSLSAQKVLERLKTYLNDNNITDAKIWVTGYSRSAGVANLVGKHLNENLQYYSTAEDDIYVYAYEPPNCSADGTTYENIHNIIDSRDFIAYVYPAAWGLSRCGVTEMIGDSDKMIMSKKFALMGENLMTDYQEVNLAEFLDEYVTFLSQYISRETYENDVEGYFCSISEMVFSLNESQRAELLAFLKQFSEEFANDENTPNALLNLVGSNIKDKYYEELVTLILSDMDKAYEKVGFPLGEEQFEELKDVVHPLIFTLKPALKADFALKKVNASGKTTTVALYYLLTLLGNLRELVGYHIYDSVYDHLAAADSFFGDNDMMLIGDSDGDGSVTVLDATAIQKDLARLYNIEEDRTAVCDADYDGEVTIMDATCIQKYLAALGNPYHIDEFLLD